MNFNKENHKNQNIKEEFKQQKNNYQNYKKNANYKNNE